MQEQNDNLFVQEFDKLMSSQVAITRWALNMDLLAIVTFDNLIQLFRISYKFQRVFQIEEAKPIRALNFSLDSQLIAYGLSDGTVRVIKAQNGQKVVIVEELHKGQVQNLCFINYFKVEPKLFMPFQKNSIESKLILNVSPHKNCNKNAIIKINYFNEISDEFVLLLSSERNKTCILLNGFMPIAHITYGETNLSNFRVMLSHYDTKFISILGSENINQFVLHHIQYEASQLKQYQEEIVKLNCLMGLITEFINFVEGTYVAMEVQVKDILRQYNSKIDLIDDSNHQGINPCDELFRFLNLGITSSALVNFFSKQLYDSKIPQKLDETLSGLFASLHDLILQSTQNTLERTTILLQRLKNMGQAESFKIFNINALDLNKIIDKISLLYTMTEILLVESTQAKFDIRNLLVWLNKSTIKTSQENDVEIQNTKSYLNKYTVDFNRLHNFLRDPYKFRLENLSAFFSKNDEARGLNIQPAQFRLFNKSKPCTNPQLDNNFHKLSKLLEIDTIILPQTMTIQKNPFRSFKIEIGECLQIWKNIATKPILSISKLISTNYKMTEIGKVPFNELYPFQIKEIVKNGSLLVYFIQRTDKFDKIVEYNCHLKIKNYLFTEKYNVVSLAVAEGVIAVLQERFSKQKIVAEIANENFDGNEIEIGRQILKLQGQLDINSSLRGLNSLIVDKNKLIIFD